MAQAMERDSLSARQRARLAVIGQSGAALLEVINAVLDISRIEAGRMEIVRAPFDLDALADTLRQLYGGLARDKGLDFTLEIAPGAGGWRDGDAARLRQVMSNLISNAIKFTDAGGVAVRIGGDAAALTCAVTDTGVGVPETRRAQIFDKFVQVDGSSTRRTGGSGLGLAICRELVALMGGHIELESKVAHGSSFHLHLPLEVVREEGDDAPPAVRAPDGGGLRVLLVEDDTIVAAVVRGLLEQQGHHVSYVGNGLAAMTELAQGEYHAMLLDLDLPGVDGFQIARLIRQREDAAAHLPIIAITARSGGDEEERAKAAGMDGFLRKPLTGEQLAEALLGVRRAASAQDVQDGVQAEATHDAPTLAGT